MCVVYLLCIFFKGEEGRAGEPGLEGPVGRKGIKGPVGRKGNQGLLF